MFQARYFHPRRRGARGNELVLYVARQYSIVKDRTSPLVQKSEGRGKAPPSSDL
jgi:hypothetical protein